MGHSIRQIRKSNVLLRIKEDKAVEKQKKQSIGDWLYFCPKEIDVRDLYEVVSGTYETEIWEDAGVLEIVLGEKSSVDIERAFAKEHKANSVFLVTFAPEDYKVAETLMKQILGQHGGIFCGDTEDFMPQVKEA